MRNEVHILKSQESKKGNFDEEGSGKDGHGFEAKNVQRAINYLDISALFIACLLEYYH